MSFATQYGKTLRKFLTLPDGWNDAWNAAKAASGSIPAVCGIYGDSVSQGAVASDWKLGFFELFRASLLTRYSLCGDFYLPTYSTAFVGSGLNGTLPFAMGANSLSLTDWGYGQLFGWANANFGTNPVVFNSANAATANCIDADIVYLNNNGGTFTWSVDGGTGTVQTTFNDSTLSKVAVGPFASGSHTVSLTAQSADFAGLWAGVSTFQNRNAGIFFSRFGGSGFSISNYSRQASGDHPNDRCKIQQGTTHAGVATGFGVPVQPHLAIIELGINDDQNHVGYHGFRQGLRRLCWAIRRGQANASILFVIASNPDPTSSELTSGWFTDSQNYGFRSAAVKDVATEFGAAVYDVHAEWMDRGVSLGYQSVSQPHPTTSGHARIATVLEAIL